jgi:hypothetical protein
VGYGAHTVDKNNALRQLTEFTNRYNAENNKNPATNPIDIPGSVPTIPGTAPSTSPVETMSNKPNFVTDEFDGQKY